ncbi:c6 zinc finger domain containing protein [Ophiostoma piceae UAMH 11346]|uniref:C6 zinc finger domain containing protein n=1 Tax=Ophiostoma piceae (strain UAMH 11346) TaxID=1262450 RepID=S3CV97_OPHP1|nr:c6 zinc finger domain containing protein [Ophiostoma piceae UAMH 11346]
MDHGPETKKARLSTTGSSWAPLSSSSSSIHQLHHSTSHPSPNTVSHVSHASHVSHHPLPTHQQHPYHPSQQHNGSHNHSLNNHNTYGNSHAHTHSSHPTPPPPGAYQAGHSSSTSSLPAVPPPSSNAAPLYHPPPGSHPPPPSHRNSSHPPDHYPVAATSPAPVTPVSAHSYTNTTTLPPLTSNGTGTNGRHSRSHSHSQSQAQGHTPLHHPESRHHHEPEPYAAAPDQRHQDYRQPLPTEYRQDSRPASDYRQPPDYRQPADYRSDFRFPRSPAVSGGPPPPTSLQAYSSSSGYSRSGDGKQPPQAQAPQHPAQQHPLPPPHQQVNDDTTLRNRPGSAASGAGAAQSQQGQSPTPSHQMDDRQHMTFDNRAHPNLGGGHHHQQHPQHPQHQQPLPHPQQQHTQHASHPSQHPSHQPPGHVQQQGPPPSQLQPPQHGPPPAPLQPLQPPQQHQQQPGPPSATTSMYRQPSYTPSTPTAAAPTSLPQQQQQQQPIPASTPSQHYDQQSVYNHPTSMQSDAMYPITAFAAAGKKKAQRASQACDSCRTLKAKCDEMKPCKNCREKNIDCKYRDPIPKQQDKVTADILDSIMLMRADMDAMIRGMRSELQGAVRNEIHDVRNELVQEMTTLKESLKSVAASVEDSKTSAAADAAGGSGAAEDMDVDGTDGSAVSQTGGVDPKTDKAPLSPDEAHRIMQQMQEMQEHFFLSVEPGPAVAPGEPAIPAHHTTLAGLLLTWPTIRERVQHLLIKEGIDYPLEYPIRQEEQRGNIRFYGRGEGFDNKPAARKTFPNPTGEMRSLPMERGTSSGSSSQGSDDNEDGKKSSAFPGEMWGQVGGLTPPSNVDYVKNAPTRTSNGDLDLSDEKVWKYVKSYEDNIQNMHPLIIPEELYAMVAQFLRTVPKAGPNGQGVRSWAPAPVATFTNSPEMSQTGGSGQADGSLKRKRSSPAPGTAGNIRAGGSFCSAGGESSAGGSGEPSAVPHKAAVPTPTLPLKAGHPFRTMESALVLSILALGKICLYTESRIPDVVSEADPPSPAPMNAQSSPAVSNAHISNSSAATNNMGFSPGVSVLNSPAQSPVIVGGHGSTPGRRTSQSSALPMVNIAGANAAAAAAGGVSSAATEALQASSGGSSSVPLASPGGSAMGGGRASAKSKRSNVTMRRNIDEIPGLDYFAVACDIMGQHIGGRELQHVWVFIIACLYYGQLGRPIQSLEMVAIAGRHLQAIIRPNLHRYSMMRSEATRRQEYPHNFKPIHIEHHHRDNLYIFAFWTCLQLESDILAELRLPPSGILAYEQQMPYPSGEEALRHGFRHYVIESYSAQLYLRNQLNNIHKNLYDGSRGDGHPNHQQIDVFTDVLDATRWVPLCFAFSDEDAPPREILAARLRAKYWGGQVILHRFFIKRILEANYCKRERQQKKEAAAKALAEYRSRGESPPEGFIMPEAYDLDAAAQAREKEIYSLYSLQLAARGIQALIESTRAFHGLPEKRFIITNVFGTAHAQWGNLLILDSIQRDPTLGCYLGEVMVNELFERTISFFELVSQPSSSLGYDLRILRGLFDLRKKTSIHIPQKAWPPKPPRRLGPDYIPPYLNEVYPMMPGDRNSLAASVSENYQPAPPHPYDQYVNKSAMLEDTFAQPLQPQTATASAVNISVDMSDSPQQRHQKIMKQHSSSSPSSGGFPQQQQQQQQQQQTGAVQHISPSQMSPMEMSPPQMFHNSSSHNHQQGQYPLVQGVSTSMAGSTRSPLQYRQSLAGYNSPPGPGSAMQSPMQGRPPLPMQYNSGTSAVKTPSTPSETDFPHHLPQYGDHRTHG